MQEENQVVADAAEITTDAAAATEAVSQVTEASNGVEIPDMPYEQLEQVGEAVTLKLRQAREKAKAADINTVKTLVAKHGLKWGDIKPASTGVKSTAGSTVPAKYKNPETGATWTGRGRAPVWIKDQDRDQFLIDKAPAA